MTIRRLLAGAALAACPLLASAAETTEPLLVTPNRTPLTADETLASVSVLTREDIARRQPRDLPDLLSELPGVDLSRNGGAGKTTSLSLRGTSSDQTLVLIDGVRVNSATSGSAALEDIPPEQIQRIEVVRGPRASLYGADAIGGVVQIFTRGTGTRASAGYGSDRTSRLGVGTGHEGEAGGFSINASRFDTDGFDALEQNDTIYRDPDDDGYTNISATVRGDYRVTENLTVSGALFRSEADNEYDATSATGSNEAENVQQSWVGEADWTVSEAWRSRFSIGRSFLDGIDEREGERVSRFITRRNTASWQNDFSINDSQLLTIGADYEREEVGGSSDFVEDSRDNLGIFVQQQWFLGPADLQVALRQDDNEAYGEQTTGSIAAGYRISQSLRTFASWGTAFRAPTFNDLFAPEAFGFVGNPDLDPERSRTGELGLSGSGRLDWSISVFRTQVDDLIVNAFDVGSGLLTPANVDEAVIEGIELDAGTRIAELDVSANFTWLDPRDEATDNILPRRARHLAQVTLERRVGPALLGADVQYRGDRYDDAENEIELDGYTTLDLRAEWSIDRHWSVRARLDNALDEDYSTATATEFTSGEVSRYGSAGRSAFVSLHWQAEPSR